MGFNMARPHCPTQVNQTVVDFVSEADYDCLVAIKVVSTGYNYIRSILYKVANSTIWPVFEV